MGSGTSSKGAPRRRSGLRVGPVAFLLALGFALASSCAPPDRGIVVDGSLGGGAGEGSGAAGSLGGASSGGTGGSAAGGTEGAVGGSPSSGGGSGGGEPLDCEDSEDCTTSLEPVCDEDSGECRACEVSAECETDRPGTPLCSAEGACVECLSEVDCAAGEPICEVGTCRGCEDHAECESLVCRADGICEDQAAVVYALALTGSTADSCGTIEAPCRFIDDAGSHLGASRPYLVFLPTAAAFESSGAVLTLPAGVDITVIGNSVELPSSAEPIITASGGVVRLEDVVLTGSGSAAADPDQMLIEATGGTLFVENSVFQESAQGIYATDTEVHVRGSEFLGLRDGGVSVSCSSDCTGIAPSTIEQSRFEGMRTSIYAGVPGTVISNNVLLEVGTGDYNRGVMLHADDVVFEFNTLIRSGCCYFTGLIACDGASSGIALRGNVSYQSTTLSQGGDGTPCYDQIYYSCPNPQYSVIEVTYPGTGNFIGDPEFVDYDGGDYHLAPGSPAIDLVESSGGPDVDFDGNPRPIGDSRDAGAFESQ